MTVGGRRGPDPRRARAEIETIYEIGRAPPPPPRPVRPPRVPDLEIVRETPGWTAVHKPAGLASVKERWQPGAPTALSRLHDLWLAKDPAAPRPWVIHRLDKETSGIMLFGRDAGTARALSEAFRKRRVRKEYLALVAGLPPEPSGESEIRLLPDPRKPERMLVVEKRGKKSVTAWETVEEFRGWTLLRVLPRTGRTHQIRATLHQLGCPVAADPLYGDAGPLFLSAIKPRYKASRDREERPLLGRLGLHAHRLVFEDPTGPGEVVLEAPPPKDLRVALEKLRRYAASRGSGAAAEEA